MVVWDSALTRQLLAFTVSSYRQSPLKLLFVFFALLSGIVGLSSVMVINETAKQSYAQASQPLFANLSFRLKPLPRQSIHKQQYAELRRSGLQATPIVYQELKLQNGMDIQLLALDVFSLPMTDGLTMRSQSVQQGTLFMGAKLAEKLSISSGEEVLTDGQEALGIAQTLDSLGDQPWLLMDVSAYSDVFGVVQIDELWVFGELDDTQLDAVKGDFLIEPVLHEDPATLTDSFHLNLLAMGLLMFIVCMFIVLNAFHLMLAERRKNLLIMRQFGISRRTLLRAISIEIILLSLIASALGSWLGIQLAQFLSPAVNMTLTSLYEVSLTENSINIFKLFLYSFLVATTGAFIAALGPIFSLSKELSNVRQFTQKLDTNTNKLTLLTIGLGLTFVLTMLLTDSLYGYFFAIGCLILLGCSSLVLLLPWGIRIVQKLVKGKWVLTNWAVADSVRISVKSKVAMSAFFIAVTANIGMNLMVDSFKSATQEWLQQRLIADYYLSTQNPDVLKEYFATNYPDFWLWERKRLKGNIDGQEIDVIAYPHTERYQDAMTFKSSEPNVWQRFSSNGMSINEQMAFQMGLQLGDKLTFFAGEKRVTRAVSGIHYDYGNMDKQILLPSEFFSQNQSRLFMFALHEPDANKLDLAKVKADLAKLDGTNAIFSFNEIMAISVQTFDRAFLVTGALNLITLLVAAFSLATSISIIELQNSPYQGLIRSFGVSRYKLLGLSLVQYFLLTFITGLLAIPFGILLSWLLIYKVNVSSFFWSYPLIIDGQVILNVILASLVIVLISVAFPVWRNQKHSIANRLAQL